MLFSQPDDQDKVYIDKNHKIQWIWANLKGTMVKSVLTENRLPLKPLFIALLAGLITGVVLSFII